MCGIIPLWQMFFVVFCIPIVIFDKRSLPVALEPTKAPAEPAWRISGKDFGSLVAMRLGSLFFTILARF